MHISIQEYTIAVIHEAIRMFPIALRLGRRTTTDTLVKGKIFDTHSFELLREVDVSIQAGTDVVLDVMGLHMNRRLFKFLIDYFLLGSSPSYKALVWGDNAEKFIPERFIDTECYRWPREACT
jgi:hypothetical protein